VQLNQLERGATERLEAVKARLERDSKAK
jgi:hypothetical protein